MCIRDRSFDNNFTVIDRFEQQAITKSAVNADDDVFEASNKTIKCNSDSGDNSSLDIHVSQGATIANDNIKGGGTLGNAGDQSTQRLIQKLEKLNRAVYESQILDEGDDKDLEESDTLAMINNDLELIQKLEKLNQVIYESQTHVSQNRNSEDTLGTSLVNSGDLDTQHSSSTLMMMDTASDDLGYASFKDINLIDCNESNV